MSRNHEPSDWQGALNCMLGWRKNALAHDPEFMNNALFSAEAGSRLPTPEAGFDLLMGEAEKTLVMIEPYLRPGARVLEVGGGVGLVYAMLRSRGIDAVSLEPGADGFGNRHRAGLRLLEMLEIDAKGWLEMGIEDLPASNRQFDLVFSFFVLEHIPSLDQAFQVMSRVLAPDGLMVHCCPNYTVPFEPHFNIPLIPLRPEWTALLHPGLRQSGMWRGLRFTTVGGIRKLCACHGLRPTFRKGMTAWALERVLSDSVFAARKRAFVKLARLLRGAGMLKVLSRLPSLLDTPIEFSARKFQNPK